jgi:hypothetical protein
MTQQMTETALWCLAAGTLVVVVLLLRQRRITATVRRQNMLLEVSLRAREEEVRHLVTTRIPALAESLYQHLPVPGLRDEQLAGTEFARNLHRVLDLFAGAVDKARARADQSAKAALKASMRALQGLANEQQLAISEMQERHDHPDVLRDLLEIDHTNSQFGRRAQAISVLCGSWPGRQRAASPLLDVVRGAKSRIRDYRRVEVNSRIDVAVISRAVEPVVLAVAELMDNAARHSQPNTTVEVSLRPSHNGACVVIDDAGVGMDGDEIRRASLLLTGRQSVDVTRLGDPPQFGFSVIGVLAARYGFSVSVDTRSPYGGVRAVLFLPSALLTHVTDGVEAAPGRTSLPPAPAPSAAPSAPSAQPPQEAPAAPTDPGPPARVNGSPYGDAPAAAAPQPAEAPATSSGLPRRRRKRPQAQSGAQTAAGPQPLTGPQAQAEPQPPADPQAGTGWQTGTDPQEPAIQQQDPANLPVDESPAAAERSARETARRMGAFARGTRSGRAAADPEAPQTPHDPQNPYHAGKPQTARHARQIPQAHEHAGPPEPTGPQNGATPEIAAAPEDAAAPEHAAPQHEGKPHR